MGIWDWYNRPGGRATMSTRTAVIVMIVAGVLSTVVIWILYALLAPFIFRPIPVPVR